MISSGLKICHINKSYSFYIITASQTTNDYNTRNIFWPCYEQNIKNSSLDYLNLACNWQATQTVIYAEITGKIVWAYYTAYDIHLHKLQNTTGNFRGSFSLIRPHCISHGWGKLITWTEICAPVKLLMDNDTDFAHESTNLSLSFRVT